MTTLDVRSLVNRLETIESVALMDRAASTNLLGKKIVAECFENDIPMPSAVIIAREQFAAKGRLDRTWLSPAGKGIYATVLNTRTTEELALVPLHAANIVASFLRETYKVDARIKWPNDILIDGKKVAGILIEARTREQEACLLIGIGINVRDVTGECPPTATSLERTSPVDHLEVDTATVAFVEFVDRELSRPLTSQEVLTRWRELAVHQRGEKISCKVGERDVIGRWGGIDDHGHAIVQQGTSSVLISGGDLIQMEPEVRPDAD